MPASVGIRGEAVAPPVHPNRRTEARASRLNRIRVSPLEGQRRRTLSLARKFHELHLESNYRAISLGSGVAVLYLM